MSDSLLNNSWPSFSKLWMKRWSFKRASECKPCTEFTAIPDSRCATPDADPNLSPLETGDPLFMVEEKDDESVDLDNCYSDTMSSSEDLPSLDSSLQGTEYYKDLVMMEDKNPDQETPKSAASTICVSGGPNISFDNGEIVITCTKPFLCPMTFEAGSPSQSSIQNEKPCEEHVIAETIPILVRSLSTSRRHSWDDAISPTDTVRRFSLDASGMDSDGERELQASTGITIQEFQPPSEPWVAKASLKIEDDVDGNLILEQSATVHKDEDSSGKRLRSKSMPSTLDKISTPRISRSLESSCPVIEVVQPPAMEIIEKDHVEPAHVLFVQQVLQELKQYHGTKCKQEASGESKQNLTWYEFLSNETEDTGKPEKVERGTKVKRRLSSLKNRVTGSWQKDKGKIKEQLKEKVTEPKDTWINVNGHKLVPGCFSSHAKCTLCTKALANGRGLQCMHCAVNVHKNCKTLLPECTSSKSKYNGSHSCPNSVFASFAASLKDHPRIAIIGLDGAQVQGRGLGMTVTNRGNSRVEIQTTAGGRTSSTTSDMDELDSNISKQKIFTEDNLSLAPSSTESLFVEEAFYSSVRSELETDAVELETESWSSSVEPPFAKKQKKEVIKRQDVIYELMQTEMHHVRTLKIMLKVYCRALREELHWNKEINHILPCVDELLELHGQFLSRFKERRKESLEEGSDRNYIIQKIGDILVQQFSGDTGERMKDQYGIFCSLHNRAVSHYKFLMRENKKFQNLMKKIGNSSIVRRLGVPECILLVTQRITKYPVLVERILQNTEEGTEDYEALTQALTLIKETITEIDLNVHKSEKVQRLEEIIAKIDAKSSGKLNNRITFRKHDMEKRQLLHDGMLYWKTASGRLKDILAVLLTDVLLLLQEKDQKYIFSSVDAKPPVISLQKLIVREVANEEKAMFLISASLTGPEMYEIHTASKEERNTWMTLIRGAVESCPDDGEITNEVDIERKQAYERAAKIKDYQERLNLKDVYIMQTLNEKLQLYIDMAEIYGFDDSSQGSKRLFVGSDIADNLKGEGTLLSATAEAQKIHSMLLCAFSTSHDDTSTGVCALPRRSETFGGYDSSGHSKSGSFKQRVRERRTTSTSSESHTQDLVCNESDIPVLENSNPSTTQESELVNKMQTLLQLLYSLQSIVTQQDSYFEIQREREKQLRQQSSRGNWLLEQEKQRNFEKQREELANVQKQQEQLKQEKQRWERERTKVQRDMEAAELRLRQREEASRIEKEKFDQERSDLEKQRQAYQHDLERLREAQRAVEKDRERLEQLKKMKKTSVSAGSFSPDMVQVTLGLTPSASFNGEGMQSLEGAGQLVMKPLSKTSASVSAADYLERPEVMRRDSNSTDTRPALKNDVPIHLLSATNQIQKQALPTKQQIPTKLAALSKSGKEKASRGKASHRTDSSASIDHRLLFPSKLSGKDESTIRSRRSASPSLTNSLTFFPQEPSGQGDLATEMPPYHSSLYRQSSAHLLTPSIPLPPPPAPATEEDTNKEDVIFF
uniref:Rho guanine nucleotide exchange factor 28 n=1 Tax=Pyxicephalus adspersus TaxID=30357 RepID=A0AAV3ABE4_PYXAD|nr:TPA: hypothetical protein GDO54_008920 [Pyxicephalus adspersus]